MAKHPYTPGALVPRKASPRPPAKTFVELMIIAERLGMTAMGEALDRLIVNRGQWLRVPEPERIGRRSSRPWTAYQALARKGLADVDGEGRYRVRIANPAETRESGQRHAVGCAHESETAKEKSK